MFKWLSKLTQRGVPAPDLATLQQAVEACYMEISTMQTNIARIERKVYRDTAKGDGDLKEAVEALQPQAEEPFSIDNLAPGDQVPPGVQL